MAAVGIREAVADSRAAVDTPGAAAAADNRQGPEADIPEGSEASYGSIILHFTIPAPKI